MSFVFRSVIILLYGNGTKSHALKRKACRPDGNKPVTLTAQLTFWLCGFVIITI